MTNTTKRIIFFQKFAALTALAHAVGIDFLVTSYYRTQEEQKKLYDEGKSHCDGYNKLSPHQKWLAIDIVLVRDGKLVWDRCKEYETLGNIWKMLGGFWGADIHTIDDIYHFQASIPYPFSETHG